MSRVASKCQLSKLQGKIEGLLSAKNGMQDLTCTECVIHGPDMYCACSKKRCRKTRQPQKSTQVTKCLRKQQGGDLHEGALAWK
jgi:hypothetical protein